VVEGDGRGVAGETAGAVPETVRRMRWLGWGDPAHPPALPPEALAFLRETVGVGERPRPPVALSHVRLAPSALSAAARAKLGAIVGAANVRDDHEERVLHAAGKGYPDLVRMRSGSPAGAPDAVVLPDGAGQLAALLELCARSSLAVVPFGGGTSVVGGVEPLRGEHAGVIALDTSRMADLVALDRQSRTVTVQAGMRAPALERLLAGRGLTLGHYPQSFEYVSLGGCAATRSAGQASTGYGTIEKMIVGLRMSAPSGEIALPALPASAAGPSLRQLLIGSEGTLGVISELSLRVRPAPRERRNDIHSRRIHPVKVLEYQRERPVGGRPQQRVGRRGQRAEPLDGRHRRLRRHRPLGRQHRGQGAPGGAVDRAQGARPRPERRRARVVGALPAADERATAVPGKRLLDQPRLADPGRPRDEQHPAATRTGRVQPVEHQLKLRAAADERPAAVHGVEYRGQCQH